MVHIVNLIRFYNCVPILVEVSYLYIKDIGSDGNVYDKSDYLRLLFFLSISPATTCITEYIPPFMV